MFKTLALLSLLLLTLATLGCLNKIPVVARYQASATEKCEAAKLELRPAIYVLEDNGLLQPIPCDPSLPEGSMLSCFKKSQSWALRCEDKRAVAILPVIDNPAFFDYGKAKDRGEKFWCVIAVAGNSVEACKPLTYPSCDPSTKECQR